MKLLITKCVIFLLVAYSNEFTAQFNTLTFNSNQSQTEKLNFISENHSVGNDNTSVSEDSKKKTDRRNPKRTTKAELKNQLDSLRMLIIDFSEQKNQKLEQSKSDLKNSIKNELEEKLIEAISKKGSNQSIKKYELIEENSFINKIYMPLKNNLVITSSFGGRIHPIFGGNKMHNGVDFKANYEHVYSVLDGVVTEAGWDSKGGGNYIKIRHSNKYETAYLHLSQIYYKPGDFVKAGYIIAKSGNSGNSTGPHLHFSVKENNTYVNPIYFLNDLIKVNNLISLYHEK